MTIKPIVSPPAGPDSRFPDFPPRDDMQNSIYLDEPACQPALRRHLGATSTTLVISEMPISRNVTQRREGVLIPDLLVAFNVDRAAIIAQRGYAIVEQGKPPDFVLEIASPTTANNDESNKRIGYAGYGVPEYWRFDPEGGKYYETHLAGDRLVDEAYQSIPINRFAANMYWGHSDVLNLDICWEHGQLRWYDPEAGRYLPTYDDAYDGRVAEAAARVAAEARIQELEAEIQRLQNP